MFFGREFYCFWLAFLVYEGHNHIECLEIFRMYRECYDGEYMVGLRRWMFAERCVTVLGMFVENGCLF